MTGTEYIELRAEIENCLNSLYDSSKFPKEYIVLGVLDFVYDNMTDCAEYIANRLGK